MKTGSRKKVNRRTGCKRTGNRRTGRRRTGCRRTENPFSRGRTIYRPQKDDSTN